MTEMQQNRKLKNGKWKVVAENVVEKNQFK